MKPLHISLNSEHWPFRVQTKRLHIIFHTFIPSLPPSTRTSHSCHQHISTGRHPIIPHFCSTCPNHLNLPRLTTSSTLCTPKRLYKSTLRFLSFSDTPHIHLTIIRSVLSRLCRFAFFIAQVSVPYVNALWTQALYVIFVYLNRQFAEGVILEMETMWAESDARTPLICFLSMGSDPTENIERLAKSKGISEKLHNIYHSTFSGPKCSSSSTPHIQESLLMLCIVSQNSFCSFP